MHLLQIQTHYLVRQQRMKTPLRKRKWQTSLPNFRRLSWTAEVDYTRIRVLFVWYRYPYKQVHVYASIFNYSNVINYFSATKKINNPAKDMGWVDFLWYGEVYLLIMTSERGRRRIEWRRKSVKTNTRKSAKATIVRCCGLVVTNSWLRICCWVVVYCLLSPFSI